MNQELGLEQRIFSLLKQALVSSHGIWKTLAMLALCLLVATVGGAVLAFLAPLYTAALIVAITAAVLVLRDTQWGFIATIAVICLLPFAALPVDIGFEPTFLDLALMSVFFVWASRVATRRQAPFIASPLAMPILAFVMMMIVAILASLGHSSLTTTFIRRFGELVLAVLSYFAVINLVRTRQQLLNIVRVIMIAGALCAAIGIILYVIPDIWAMRALSALRIVRYPSGPGVLRYIEDNPDLAMRATSTSQDPNVLGGLLILLSGLTIPQMLSDKPLFPKRYIAGMAGLMVICLVLTYSRGSLGGLAVGLSLVALLRYPKLAVYFAIGLVLLLFLPQTQTWVEHFIEGVRMEDLATQMRLGEYSDAIKVILAHPWLGVGFMSTPEIDLYVGVSNVYLLIGEEMGLIGLSAFLIILIVFFAQMRQGLLVSKSDQQLDGILWGLFAALTGALAAGMLDHYFFNIDFPHAATIFWMYMGLAMVTTRLVREPQEA